MLGLEGLRHIVCSLVFVYGLVLNPNHQRSESISSHCATCLHFSNWVNILRGSVIIGVHGFW